MAVLDETKVAQLKAVAGAVAKDHFLELFDLTVRPQGRKWVLAVVLDKKSGSVTLNECTGVSRELEKRLDEMDLIESSYLLEVSSPGLDRPLRGPEDYERFQGKLAHLVLSSPMEGRTDFQGRLGEVKEGRVGIAAEGGNVVWLPLSAVKKANLVVEI